MDVADWLRALDLGQYESAFHENSVTAELLPSLTLEDLKDLGISRVGHRRRLLDAIARCVPERNRPEIRTAGGRPTLLLPPINSSALRHPYPSVATSA